MKTRISLSQWLLITAGCLLLGSGALWMVHASKHQGDAILRTKEGPQEMEEAEYKAYRYTNGGILIAVGIVFLGFGFRKKKAPETATRG